MPTEQPLDPAGSAAFHLLTFGTATLARAAGAEGKREPVLGPGKPFALIAYLALSPGRMATRGHLADLLWSDLEPDRARHALRQTLWQLRQVLGDEGVAGQAEEIRLSSAIWTDRDAFIEAVESEDLQRAVDLYLGPFLPAFAVPGGLEFEQWADVERTTLRNTFLRAADALTRRLTASHHHREAQQLARRVRDEDPLNERSWRLLIETRFVAGDVLGAHVEADTLVRMLQEEGRGQEPSTTSLLERIRSSENPEGEASDTSRGLVADLIGREAEFAAMLGAWESARRGRISVTHLEAPAGLGKTRLLQDLRSRLILAGATVVYVRASPGDRHVSYGYASDIATALSQHPGATGISTSAAGSLVALNPTLSNVFDARADTSVDAEALRRRSLALTELYQAVSEERPLAMLLDDLHWADLHSVRLLEAAATRVAGAPVYCTVAERSGIGQWRGPATDRLVLPSFSVAEIHRLIASLGEVPAEPWSDVLADRLYDATRGSPLLVLESLKLAIDRGWLHLSESRWTCDDPDAVSELLRTGGALRHRLGRLTPSQRDLLVLLAEAGAPLEATTLLAATGRPADSLGVDLTALEAHGSVRQGGGRWEPSHDEVASAALEPCDAARRKAVHEQLGRAFESEGGRDPGVLQRAAFHWRAADREADLSRVLTRWLAVARRARDSRPTGDLAAALIQEPRDSTIVRRLLGNLPLWTRIRLASSRNLALGVALGGVLIASGGALAAFGGSAPAPEARLLLRLPSGEARVLELRDDPRSAGLPLDPVGSTKRWKDGAIPWEASDAQQDPLGHSWAYSRASTDSGGVDLYLLNPAGAETRLTAEPGDDTGPTWSPDGRFLAFATGRWSNAGWSDVAVMDIPTRQIRRITASNFYDISPVWSPDGSRIAFIREDRTTGATGGPRACAVSIDGASLSCIENELDLEGLDTHAWLDADRVLVTGFREGRQGLYRVDLRTGVFSSISTGIDGPIFAGAGGEWNACFCRLSGEATYEWYVFPLARPSAARRLDTDRWAPAEFTIAWAGAPTVPGYVERVHIGVPDGPIPMDGTYALHAHGISQHGASLELPVISWTSLDTLVARIDIGSGVIRPVAEGIARLVASAGGWRSDTVSVRVGPPGWNLVQRETWKEGWTRWRPFGIPFPKLMNADGIGTFWNRGDSTFESGAYSISAWPATAGLGLEASVEAPITDVHWQAVEIGLVGWVDSTVLAAWDHQTGWLAGERLLSTARSCSLGYPNGEGPGARFEVVAEGGGVDVGLPADSSLGLGAPFTVRVQIFPDRRCGIAVNGRPIWMSPAPLALDRGYRALISGKSYHAKILVGPVTIWTGVRRDIDWEEVSP